MLLDLLMPTLSGFDMLSLMAANQWLEEIPVVMISSENDADTIHRAYDLGVSDYITRRSTPMSSASGSATPSSSMPASGA